MGRRRALGSSRSALTVLLLLAVGLPTVIGTGLGAAVGLGTLSLIGSSPPATAFTLSACWLVVMSAVAATVVPVIRAAWSDPVAILRVP
jgi:putative ABC transport system permease protein